MSVFVFLSLYIEIRLKYDKVQVFLLKFVVAYLSLPHFLLNSGNILIFSTYVVYDFNLAC